MEITNRIQRYLHTAGPCTQVPIAEAMVNYKDEDSCQIFVPFISVSILVVVIFAMFLFPAESFIIILWLLIFIYFLYF